jgi:membrane-bound ClpP family serine protease
MTSRPAELSQAVISGIVGAIMILVGAFSHGFDFNSFKDPEVLGAITLLIGFVSSAVTWFKAKQQRAGELLSRVDGTVAPSKPEV